MLRFTGAMRFCTHSAETQNPRRIAYHRLWWLLAIVVAMVALHSVVLSKFAIFVFDPSQFLPRSVASVLVLLATASLAILVWRIVLAARYRPVSSVSDEELPTITVVIPAFNEGRQVLSTLRSLADSNYPEEKIRLVAVDDGSTDDTWSWIVAASEELGERMDSVHCPQNQGKRHALYEGIKRSCGHVVVTVDSDSEVGPDTLRNLVSPFVYDSRVGAVAGNVCVMNVDDSVMGKMLDIVFTYSFDFIRASQSEVNTVMCTPGALSAYRRDLVLEVLETWLAQTFFGKRANIGEDRAMTNLILRRGYHVKFQGNAVVWTDVPRKTLGLAKMFLRWARSNVRETLVMATFIFRRFRWDGALGARINFVSGVFRMAIATVFWLPMAVVATLSPAAALPALAIGVVASAIPSALTYALICSPKRSAWAFVYAPYYLLALSWITPYALFTAGKNSWLTRQSATPPRAANQNGL